MNILLTNDDGIDFPGLSILREELQSIGKVFVFAPTREKSGTSQALSIFDDVYVQPLDKNTFIVNGYPVDCINIGLHGGLIHEPVDIIVSGINKGVNMGDDIYYSGTVGAARHGFIHGYPSLAVSCGYLDENGDYASVSKFVKSFIEENASLFKKPVLLNINHPVPAKNVSGIKWTKLGRRIYRDTYKKTRINKQEYYFNLGGSELSHKEEKGTDFEAYENNYVSITPLKRDATDYEIFDKEYKPDRFKTGN
ncbi:MAG: 5'/3'-nucleotidase SurE [Spirochaetia bacterium]|nr:5'/3'-nucleotidase SurE [Spirochaetia bacterium]